MTSSQIPVTSRHEGVVISRHSFAPPVLDAMLAVFELLAFRLCAYSCSCQDLITAHRIFPLSHDYSPDAVKGLNPEVFKLPLESVE